MASSSFITGFVRFLVNDDVTFENTPCRTLRPPLSSMQKILKSQLSSHFTYSALAYNVTFEVFNLAEHGFLLFHHIQTSLKARNIFRMIQTHTGNF